MTKPPIEPTPPNPLGGARGEAGEAGDSDGHGGSGGDGGRGGRGGIGVKGDTGKTGLTGAAGITGATGDTGATGRTGGRGARGLPGKEQPILHVIGETGPEGPTGEVGAKGPPGNKQSKFDRWALAIVVLVTALSAIYFSVKAQNRLDDASASRAYLVTEQAAFSTQVDCTQKVVTTTILAIKARSLFAEQQATQTLRLDQAQSDYLAAVTISTATPADRVKALIVYQKALAFNIQALKDQLRVRDLNPFPTVADIKACS